MARPNRFNWWRVSYLIGVTLMVLGVGALVGMIVYMIGLLLIRKGAPVEVLIIFGSLLVAFLGIGLAAYTEKKAKEY